MKFELPEYREVAEIWVQVVVMGLVLFTERTSSVPVAQDASAGEITLITPGIEEATILDYAFNRCAECDYFLNGCPPPDGIFGVKCPENGTETCRLCLTSQRIRATKESIVALRRRELETITSGSNVLDVSTTGSNAIASFVPPAKN